MDIPAERPALADPVGAAELRLASQAWPSHPLTPGELADLELALLGAGTFRLGADVPAGDLALREPEGEMLAVRRADGRLEGVALPAHPDYPALRRTPAEVRAELAGRSWADPLGVVVPGLLHTAELDRLAATGRPLLLLAAVGGADPADAAHHGRVRALEAAAATLRSALLTLVPLVPTAPTDRYPALAAAYGAAGVDVAAPDADVEAEIRALLDRGEPVPPALTPPAVAAELARQWPRRSAQGLTVFFTGLSGSGKSTVAGLLTVRLLERGDRRVTLLDGDLVRLHLSKGLGFSRADRDENLRRIGWVAAQVAAAGGVTVCAPIAPYDAVRKDVRAMSERTGGFVLVHVATPLEVCERRDRKGLYAKARAGLLPGFTGIDDPYEVPTDAEIRLDTSTETPESAVETVLDHLRTAGWLID